MLVKPFLADRPTDRIIFLVSPVKQQIELEWPNINFAQK